MEFQDFLNRFWTDLISRPSGPYAFRFTFQPIMAAVVAILNGIKDAKTGRPPYFWTILSDPSRRERRLEEGLKATTRILLLGFALELLYQLKVFGTFHLGEAIVVVFFLAFLPYLVVRGPADRIARWWLRRKGSGTR